MGPVEKALMQPIDLIKIGLVVNLFLSLLNILVALKNSRTATSLLAVAKKLSQTGGLK